MRKTIMMACAILLFNVCVAQKDKGKVQEKGVMPFGEVEKADLEAKVSALDKNAEAEVIFETREQEINLWNGSLDMKIRIHRRVKIFNDKGLDEANEKIAYYSKNGLESVSKLEAQAYNLDASGNVVISKMDKKSIYTKKVNNVENLITFAIPEVKVGSVLEYKYEITTQRFFISDYYFQEAIPVRYSRFRMDYPQEFHITAQFAASLPYESDKKDKNGRVIHNMSMSNLPGLKMEPYMTSYHDYWQKAVIDLDRYYNPAGHVNVNFRKTWPRVIQNLMEDEDFGAQVKKNIPRTSDLDQALKALNLPYDKMATIHKYVKANMSWDGEYSLWALDGVKTAWSKKKGNSGEVNLILVNLLKDAGLKAFPLLVSTRSNGQINVGAPGAHHFNTVMAYVQIDNKNYVLDGTNQYTPSHMIPENVMGMEALVISKVNFEQGIEGQDWGWVQLWDDKQKFNARAHINAKIGTDGSLSGEAFVDYSGYAKIDELACWKEGKEKFVENHYSKPYHGISIQDFNASNIEKDSLPMSQKLKFSIPLSSSGDYSYFSINMFCGLDKNPFIADERISDVFFGHNQQYTISGNITIPDDYVLEAIPKNSKMIMPDTSILISRIAQLSGNTLQYRISLEYLRPVYGPQEYDYLWDFHKKLYALLNEQIVVKKKS